MQFILCVFPKEVLFFVLECCFSCWCFLWASETTGVGAAEEETKELDQKRVGICVKVTPKLFKLERNLVNSFEDKP